MNLSSALKSARVDYTDLNQMDFAEKMGLTQTYVSQIENGRKKPSMDVIQRYSQVCEMPIPIILWMAFDEKDVKKNKLKVFRELKPVIDNLIKEIF